MQIIQVYPVQNHLVYVYFANGEIRLFDASKLIHKGVFEKLADPDFFCNRCTVLNDTLAWDLSGTFDPAECLDIDPHTVYRDSQPCDDPLSVKKAS
ncbi:MAG: DUF2442 domain-containing protein [Leptospiraceae bacterium]|nr:DUF2442 domain-containing protein [Leptospiraceae bacterium]